jgi:MoxR-like ATPase
MSWNLFVGDGRQPQREDPEREAWERIPPLRPWRWREGGQAPVFEMPEGLALAVNASLHLRRPLLLSGNPGSGKSTLVDLIAAELELGTVLRWHITSRSTRAEGLYDYDALGRLHATQVRGRPRDPAAADVANFVTLGPLGTALAAPKVRAVLIDEIDKSDLDLPGDLLDVMESGEFTIPVLKRERSERSFKVRGWDKEEYEIDADGVVRRQHFPVIVLTSNEERAFSAPFLRRCVRFTMPTADAETLRNIVRRHLNDEAATAERTEIEDFAKRIEDFAKRLEGKAPLAINQILEFVYLVTGDSPPESESRKKLADILLKELSGK